MLACVCSLQKCCARVKLPDLLRAFFLSSSVARQLPLSGTLEQSCERGAVLGVVPEGEGLLRVVGERLRSMPTVKETYDQDIRPKEQNTTHVVRPPILGREAHE